MKVLKNVQDSVIRYSVTQFEIFYDDYIYYICLFSL